MTQPATNAVDTPLSSLATLERCLTRIAESEEIVRAFAWLDEDRARRLAIAADETGEVSSSPLHGVPIGVKDIIDTAGIPTECGTALLRGRVPLESADVVTALERRGAYTLGKTVTAELAFAAPGPTRNPWNPERTPGGSSMGSAAGVAAGFFPVALGTQTNSSVIMPAALCGVVGFKPSAGSVSTAGILPFSPTLDQLGCFATSVEDVALVADAIAGPLLFPRRETDAAPVIGVPALAEFEEAAPAIRASFERSLLALADQGATVERLSLPQALAAARAVHRTIMAFEAAQEIGPLVGSDPSQASDMLQRFLAEGAAVDVDAYARALEERARAREGFLDLARGVDLIACPAAPDEAPSREGTGDPRFCTLWSLVGAPALTLPAGRGPSGLPIGLQLVASNGADGALLETARWVEAALAEGTA